MLGKLEQRVAIVTGAGSGIGRAIAQTLAEAEAKVLVVDLDQDGANATVTKIQQAGGEASAFEGDVANWSQMQTMAQAAVDRYNGLDILCSNAGIFPSVRLESMSESDWDKVLSTNLKGALFAVKACLPRMREQHYGRIVLTSSITGPITGYPGWTHYGASKAGMLGFMRTAAIEMAEDGITINAVMPGNIKTEGLDDVGEDYLNRMRQSIPMKALGKPEDIAHAVLFLASAEAGYITGQTLVVDGGQVLPESILALEEV